MHCFQLQVYPFLLLVPLIERGFGSYDVTLYGVVRFPEYRLADHDVQRSPRCPWSSIDAGLYCL